jgi:hypothetical protein
MISPATGEIVFLDGLSFRPHEVLGEIHLRKAESHAALPIPGWTQHFLGTHDSNHGPFKVRAVSDRESHIHAILVAHEHSFYRPGTPLDSERRAYHEGVLARDLHGQREFSWGEVYCRFNPEQHKDWIVIVFAEGPQVPLRPSPVIQALYEHQPLPAAPDAATRP